MTGTCEDLFFYVTRADLVAAVGKEAAGRLHHRAFAQRHRHAMYRMQQRGVDSPV